MDACNKPAASVLHLLSLPREIRDRIYDVVLDLETPVPNLDSVNYQIPAHFHYSIRIPDRIPRSSCAALLCCNHQLESEVSQAVSRRACTSSKNGLIYTLDLLVQGRSRNTGQWDRITPTWTKIPSLPITHAKCLHVNFQADKNHKRISFLGDGGPGETNQTLLNLLIRFFTYGPMFDGYSMMKSTPPAFIEELVMEILPVEPGEEQWKGPMYDRDPRDSIVWGLLLRMVARSGLLAGRLGRIYLCVDGEIVSQWDVADHGDL
ncbi:MAG: hypothetical protein Q9170_001495 [Blastenia crenularia]